MTALLRSFTLEVPQQEVRPPSWDLAVVLSSFLEPPYELLQDTLIAFLTQETAFLVALASAERVSELQAILGAILHREDWSEVTLQLDPTFLAKTQRSYGQATAFVLPALDRIVGPLEDDLKLCPVRAIRIYLSRTRQCRPKDSRLFVPMTGSGSSVSKNSISRWIVTAIKRAYSSLSTATQTLHRVRAHEVRAISTSWHFAHNLSLERVMDAASWRCHSTFSSFYLRDVSLMTQDMFVLGPVVAAQEIVRGSSESSSRASLSVRAVTSAS
jgi:hypothetical protein